MDFKDIKTQEDYEQYLKDNPGLKSARTMTLIATNEQHEKWSNDMSKIGWKLTFQGHSGTWLGEPIYEVKKDGK
jgi:hypothetical protein